MFQYIKSQLGPNNAHIYADFLKCIRLLTLEILSKDEALVVAADLFRDFHSAMDSFRQYLTEATQGDLPNNDEENYPSSSSDAEPVDAETMAKYKERSISATAAGSNIIGTKSYRRLPRQFPKLVSSGRSSIEEKTINSTWVSVSQDFPESSDKAVPRNSFKDNVSRCEDDRYEIDMLIERNRATFLELQQISLTIRRLPDEIQPMHALTEDALSNMHCESIQRIYGDEGPMVVAQVRSNPFAAIPVVLARLKERDVYWRHCRDRLNRKWRKVLKENYLKGADHQSLPFKIYDKKDLTPKALLLDILDPKQSQRRRESDMTRARGFPLSDGAGTINHRSRAVRAVAKSSQNTSDPSSPVLELEYRHNAVHRHAFELIKLAVLKDIHDDGVQNITVGCLRTFLTSFFGMPFEEDEGAEAQGPTVLYGDEPLYVMLRLYDYVYERLGVARAGALEMAADQRMRKTLDRKGRERVGQSTRAPNLETHPASLVRKFEPEQIKRYFRIKQISENGEELYAEFLRLFKGVLIKGVLMNKEEAEEFEDRCRIIIGPSAFMILTLDKLVLKAAQQLRQLCSPGSSSRALLELHQEMRDRTNSPVKDANDAYWEGMEALYGAAVGQYLLKDKGENVNVFRMQYLKQRDHGDILSICVVAKTTTEEHEKNIQTAASKLSTFIEFNSLWNVPNSKGRRRLFGRRNIHGSGSLAQDRMEGTNESGRKRKSNAARSQVQEQKGYSVNTQRPFLPVQVVRDVLVKRDITVRNGMEMKLSCTGKLVYISGGCDFLINRNKSWKKALGRNMNLTSQAAIKVRKLLGIRSSEQ